MWTTGDIAFLRANAELGAAELARLMERSVASVQAAAHRHRVSLRRPRERRGTLLGQPRGLRLAELLPAEVSGDRETAALVLARAALDETADLCPACCRRPATVNSTGLCAVCHKRRLAEAHRDLLAERAADRELWQSRQALKRARDRDRRP